MCVRIVQYVQLFFSSTITNVFEKLSDWNYNIRLNEITKESFGDRKRVIPVHSITMFYLVYLSSKFELFKLIAFKSDGNLIYIQPQPM